MEVVGLAKSNGLRRASLLAGGDDFAVANRPALAVLRPFRVNARVVDALRAIAALLHDTAAAYGDFGIAQELQLRPLPILEPPYIETPPLVWPVVRALAS